MRILILLCALLFSCTPRAAAVLQDGDIIFHTSRSAQSMAIQRATGSRYSHMGMILLREGKPVVFEAVQPVKYTPLQQWIERGKDRHYVVKRLKNASQVLNPDALKRLKTAAQAFIGRPYDLAFEWSDQKLYCSEIVWKLFDRQLGIQLGELQKVRDFDLSDPGVKAKMKERYGSRVPLDMEAISPRAIFESAHLKTLKQR